MDSCPRVWISSLLPGTSPRRRAANGRLNTTVATARPVAGPIQMPTPINRSVEGFPRRAKDSAADGSAQPFSLKTR
jgi:hypothetical protein